MAVPYVTENPCSSDTLNAGSGDRLLQILPQIHVPDEAVEVIRMEVKQLRAFGDVAAGLFDSSQNELALHAVERIVISKDTLAGGLVSFNQGFREILGPDTFG